MKFDLQNIMQQAQKMQSEMESIKNELNYKTVTAESGGGMVTVVMTGTHRITSVKIAPELVNPNEITMLQDLIVAAVNKANEAVGELAQQEMGKVSGMLPNIPGLNLGI